MSSDQLGYDYRIVSSLRGKMIEIYGVDKPINELPKETILNKITNELSEDIYLILDCNANYKGIPRTVSEYILSINKNSNTKCANNREDIGFIDEDELLDSLNENDFNINNIRLIIEKIVFQCDTLNKNKDYYSIDPYSKRYSQYLNIIMNQLKLVMEFYKLGNTGMKNNDIIKLLDNTCFTSNFKLYIVILINILENIKLLTEYIIDINIISSVLKSNSHKVVIVTTKNRCLRLSQHVFSNIIKIKDSNRNVLTIPREDIKRANETPITNTDLDNKILSYLNLKFKLNLKCSN
jgi:hypothetical protein